MPAPAAPVSDQIETWLRSDGDRTLGSLIELFAQESFAILFVLLHRRDRRAARDPARQRRDQDIGNLF